MHKNVKALATDLASVHELLSAAIEKVTGLERDLRENVTDDEYDDIASSDPIPAEGPRLVPLSDVSSRSQMDLATTGQKHQGVSDITPTDAPTVASLLHLEDPATKEVNSPLRPSPVQIITETRVFDVGLRKSENSAAGHVRLLCCWSKVPPRQLLRGNALREEWHHENNTVLKVTSIKNSGSQLSFRAGTRGPSVFDDGTACGKVKFHWIIHPHSMQRVFWDVLSILFITFDIIVMPLRIFPNLGVIDVFCDSMEWACAIFWTIDVAMSFRTGVIQGQRLIMNPGDIACRYATSWLIVDLCVVGSEWASRVTEVVHDGYNALRLSRVARTLRVLRMIRVQKLARTLQHLEEAVLNDFLVVISLSIVKITLCFLVLVHVLAAFWYVIGDSDNNGWVHKEGWTDVDGTVTYVHAARWVIAQINRQTDQRPNMTQAEVSYGLFCGVLAVLCQAVFISGLTTKMTQLTSLMDSRKSAARSWANYLDLYGNRLSWSLMVFISTYVQTVNTASAQAEVEKNLLSVLPRYLQIDLLYQVRSPTLEYYPLFRDIAQFLHGALRQVCSDAVVPIIEKQMTTVFSKGDICTRMMFIEDGTLVYTQVPGVKDHMAKWVDGSFGKSRVYSFTSSNDFTDSMKKHDEKHEILHNTNWVCEQALWIKWLNRGDLVASTSSRLMVLEVEKFTDVVHQHPELLSVTGLYARCFVHFSSGAIVNDMPMEECQEWHNYAFDLSSLCEELETSSPHR